jgi:DNA-binding transcriptional ArsR family regulator
VGIWRIGIDELAQSRFQISAMTETVAALATLARGPVVPGLEEWVIAHRPAYQRRLESDSFMASFVKAALGRRWTADVIAIPPQRTDRTFHDELRHVRNMSLEQARADLADDVLPEALRTPDLLDRVAALLEWMWATTLRADWPRRRRVFEADIVSRTERLANGGWAAAVGDMRPGMRWLDDGRLQISADNYPPRTIRDAELMLIPSTNPPAKVMWSEPSRYAIVYPCVGLLAGEGSPRASEPLAKLLGPVRAAVLDELRDPRSTTQLVALTGYSLGSVGAHLKVLRDAELVRRGRAGRSVLYYRTPLGTQLVEAQKASSQT